MRQLFPHANLVVGVLVLLIGFVFHWVGQLISLLSWDFATRLGLQERGLPPEYKVYEHGIAVADVAIGWVYGVAGIGLLLGAGWAYRLAWIPGVVLVYHSISFWFWTQNRRRAGHKLTPDALRIAWSLANSITGILAILLAWRAC